MGKILPQYGINLLTLSAMSLELLAISWDFAFCPMLHVYPVKYLSRGMPQPIPPGRLGRRFHWCPMPCAPCILHPASRLCYYQAYLVIIN